jgi:hypothetical protein
MSSRIEHAPERHERPRRLVLATIAVTPATTFLTVHVLQYGLGIDGAARWFDALFPSLLGPILIAVVLGGPVLAFVLAASRLLPVRLIRDDDAWEVKIRVRPDAWALAVAATSLLVGGFLIGHMAWENLACAIGSAAAC